MNERSGGDTHGGHTAVAPSAAPRRPEATDLPRNRVRPAGARILLALCLAGSASAGVSPAAPPIIAAIGSTSLNEEHPTDYTVIARYLTAFFRYVAWPPSPEETAPSKPLRIGVIGPNPFGRALDELVSGKSMQGRPLAVAYAMDPEKLPSCDIVFINCPAPGERRQAVARFAGQPVLTVVYRADPGSGESSGAVIELARTGRNIRYVLNHEALTTQGLQATPGLLENALRRNERTRP